MTAPVDTVLAALEGHGCSPRRRGRSIEARCPVHDDTNPSLSVTETPEGKVLVCCHAGCALDNVLAALGLNRRSLFPDVSTNGNGNLDVVATYNYVAEGGSLLYQVVRLVPKSFRLRRPDGRGGWIWKLDGIERVPYGLPELHGTIVAGCVVYVVEGEKDADRLQSLGLVATCNAGGAGKWPASWGARYFAGANVVVVPDNDEPGHRHAEAVAASLKGHAAEVRVVELPGLLEKGDVSDWLNAGGMVEKFLELVQASPSFASSQGDQRRRADDGDSRSDEPGASLDTPSDSRATAQPPPPEAAELASELRILDRFAGAVRRCGLVGERANAQLIYLAITSRVLDRPVSLGVKGHSSSGKSEVVKRTCRFFPSEAVLEMTAMSQRALVYSDEDYQHRFLVLYEVVALREGIEGDLTSYFVRSLLSEGQIRYPVTVKGKDGGFIVKTIVKEGPTGLIFTTTRDRIHDENETRVLSLTSDDSREQTKRVFRGLANATDTGPDLGEWVAFQSWLQTAEHRVSIPYANALANLVKPVAVRLRRDFGAVLALVQTHAILHQTTRSRDGAGRIVANLDDYEIVAELVEPLLSQGVGATVSRATRETVTAVEKLAGPGGVQALAVASHLNLDKSSVTRRLSVAARGGWLVNQEERRGRPGRWVIGEALPDEGRILPTREELHRLLVNEEARATGGHGQIPGQKESQGPGCTVARECEGIASAVPTADAPCPICGAPPPSRASFGWHPCDHQIAAGFSS